MKVRNVNRTICVFAMLLMLGCGKSEPTNGVASTSEVVSPIEPDYDRLVTSLGIEGALLAMRAESGSFMETDAAGRLDTVAGFRRQLQSLDLSPFEDDPGIEGIFMVGGRLRFDGSSGRTTQVHYLSIIDGRSELDTDTEKISVSPIRMIEALRSRSTAGRKQ